MQTEEKPSFLSRFKTIQIFVLSAFVALLLTTVISIFAYSYTKHLGATLNLTNTVIHQVNETVISKTTDYLSPAMVFVELASSIFNEDMIQNKDSERLESFLTGGLFSSQQFDSFYFGSENGNFLMVRRLSNGNIQTKTVRQSLNGPVETIITRTQKRKIVEKIEEKQSQFDARKRPWYLGAKGFKSGFWTDIYIFFSTKKPGITASYPVFDSRGRFIGAFGLDIDLSSISNFLSELKISESGKAFIIDGKQQIIAFPENRSLVTQRGDAFVPVSVKELDMPWISTAVDKNKATGLDRLVYQSSGKRYMASFTHIFNLFNKDWQVVLVAPEDDFLGSVKETNRGTMVISLIILLVALGFSWLIAKKISEPLEQLESQTRKIKNFELDDEINVDSSLLEIRELAQSIQKMKKGLQSFKRYVPASLVRRVVESGVEARLGGEKRMMSFMFTDIVGFTKISEKLSPEGLMLHISTYLEDLSKIILEYHGTIDKYIGDSVMVFWGAPEKNENHAMDACDAALKCQVKIEELNKRWKNEGKLELHTRMGISTGEAVVGNMGSQERMNYTVIGENVNLANRLEGANKIYGSKIIVSEKTYEMVKDFFIFRPLDKIIDRHSASGSIIYELAGRVGDLVESDMQAIYLFRKGFDLYFSKRWADARDVFQELKDLNDQDQSTLLYLRRCNGFLKSSPKPS